MTIKTLDDALAELSPADRKAVLARADMLVAEEMLLRDIRKAMKKTQAAVAKRLNTNQAGVSKIESRADFLLSTLRSYIEAVGGQLVLLAEFPGMPPISISQFKDIEPRSKKTA